jgi:hypothetical protein
VADFEEGWSMKNTRRRVFGKLNTFLSSFFFVLGFALVAKSIVHQSRQQFSVTRWEECPPALDT